MFDHYDAHGLPVACDKAEAEIRELRADDARWEETVGDLNEKVIALTRALARAEETAAQFRASAVEVFAADNGPAGIIPISASDAAAIKSPANRALLLHAYRTPWQPLEEGADRGN